MQVFSCQHITLACLCLHAKHVAIGITNGACMGFASKCACMVFASKAIGIIMELALQWNLQARVPSYLGNVGVLGSAPLFLFDHGV